MFAALLPILAPIIGGIAKSIFPNAEDELRRMELTNQFQLGLMQQASAIEAAAADIVKAEAQSEHFLAATWRPILMLTFGALIVARWLGFSAPGIAEPEVLKLWSIVELGLGGYVIGRSVEKIAGPIAAVLKK